MQPVSSDDGSLAEVDKEIFKVMKKRYGKETLQVNEDDKEWYRGRKIGERTYRPE